MGKSKMWSEPIRWMAIVRAHNITGILATGKGASHLRRRIVEQIAEGKVRTDGSGAYQVKQKRRATR
jgi:hypothetical protein